MVRRCVRELDRYVARIGRRYAVLAVLSLIAGFTEAGVVVLVVRGALAMTDGVDSAGAVPVVGELSVGTTLAVALVLGLAAIVVHVFTARTAAHLNSSIVAAARARLVEAYRDSTWEGQLAGREGGLQYSMSALTAQAGGVAFGAANLVSNGLSLVALMVAAMVVDPLATVVVVGFGGFVFIAIWPVRVVARRISGDVVDRMADIASAASELDRLSLEFRTAGVGHRRADDLLLDVGSVADLDRRMRFMLRLGNNLYKDLAIVFLVGLVSLWFLAGGTLAVEFGAVVILVVRAVGNAQAVQNGMQTIDEHGPGLVAFGEQVAGLDATSGWVGAVALGDLGRVEFDGVGFSYDAGRPVLSDVTFHIDPGESVGLVGPSGSGKTTLVHLALGLRTAERGRITFDGTPIGEIAPPSFAALVGFVPQEPKLVAGSIADNIRFFRDGISYDDVREAARRAHLLDVVDELPDGFDTEVSGRVGLSGGQKQRLAIARALVSSPRLLVLDEPTSALDGESERAIAATLDDLRGVVSVLVIAHRPSTVEVCDRLVHLRDGRVEQVTTGRRAGS
jgi:ABC-type multidrug transport system fused ATPase/permease subunit